MPLSDETANTPYYVLLDGNRRIGPQMSPADSASEGVPIYAFSAAGAYHAFRANCEQLLTPYPLVKVYLRQQADAAGEAPWLVIIDAASPREPRLRAATIADVLTAHETKTAHVSAAYRLVFDQETDAYKVEATAV